MLRSLFHVGLGQQILIGCLCVFFSTAPLIYFKPCSYSFLFNLHFRFSFWTKWTYFKKRYFTRDAIWDITSLPIEALIIMSTTLPSLFNKCSYQNVWVLPKFSTLISPRPQIPATSKLYSKSSWIPSYEKICKRRPYYDPSEKHSCMTHRMVVIHAIQYANLWILVQNRCIYSSTCCIAKIACN
jgi:hypothetical protein